MKRKIVILLMMFAIVFIGLSASYADNELSNNTTILSIKYDEPLTPAKMVSNIQTQPAYKNYNHTTLNWLTEFGSDYVFLSNGDYCILMNSTDAAKVTAHTKTGMAVSNNVTCNIVENRSMGSDLPNILYIENVEVISNNTDYFKFDNSV